MNKIRTVLEGIYNNLELRKSIVPCFMGKTGLGKSQIIRQFAKDINVHIELFLTSAQSPFEITGIGVPNAARDLAVYLEFECFKKLKDGDILFFDEMPNGLLPTLNASLTLLESRITGSGRKLPDIMIVAAGNYEGMTPMTPQIKERFLWYDVKFNPGMWKNFMFDKYQMPEDISSKLVNLITNEKFEGYNYCTPRSIDKAVNMVINDINTPYDSKIKSLLDTLIKNPLDGDINLGNEVLHKDEMISWLKLKQIINGIITK